MSELSVREVNEIDQLQELRNEWDQLLRQTDQASFFQTCDWLTAYWRRFGGGQQLRVLVVEQGDRLVGIVPLAVRRGRFGLRVLHYPMDNWGTTYVPLGESVEVTLTAALRYLRGAADWDLIDLRWATGVVAEATAEAFSSSGTRAGRHQEESISWVDLSGNWDDYWMRRTSKWRNNVRRNEKKLAQLGTVEWIHCQPGHEHYDRDPRWDLYEMCEAVASTSWQADSTTGNTMTHERVRGFLRDVHPRAAARGCVSMHLLRLDERPIAYAYNYVFRGRVYGLRAGFDPEFTSVGPGSVLLGRMIRYCFEHGQREFDLGEGASHYKRHWRNRTLDTYRFSHYRPLSVRAQTHRARGWFTKQFDRPQLATAQKKQ